MRLRWMETCETRSIPPQNCNPNQNILRHSSHVIVKHAHTQTDRQTDRQTARQPASQPARQPDRQTDRQIFRYAQAVRNIKARLHISKGIGQVMAWHLEWNQLHQHRPQTATTHVSTKVMCDSKFMELSGTVLSSVLLLHYFNRTNTRQ